MRILGIDPGTVSFDLCLLNEQAVEFEATFPSPTIASNPEALARTCLDLKPDAIIAPSGYGLPNRHFRDLTARDFFELTLVREGENVPVLDGMKRFFALIQESKMDILFVPGIIHLPTVPRWRKLNKIDMGTADKMCIGALSVATAARLKNIPYSDIDHIVVEVGGGYNALITIKGGQIINGIGGTLFPGPGFANAGAMDGELAYLLGDFSKALLFEGGASYLADKGGTRIADFGLEHCPEAFNAFMEGVTAAVTSQRSILESKDVYLSGRLTGYENIYRPLKTELEKLGYKVEKLPALSDKSKAAAQGYAVVGNGLYGGFYNGLVRHMKIHEASGSVTDYVYWKELC